MSIKIYVIRKDLSNSLMKMIVDGKEVQRSFGLYQKEDDVQFAQMVEQLIRRDDLNNEQINAILISGTMGCVVDDEEGYRLNKEAFLSKQRGWIVDDEEYQYVFGHTKSQCLEMFLTLIEGDEWY